MADTNTSLSELAGDIRIAMLTLDGSKGPEARPLTVQRIDDGEIIWFLVADHTQWLSDLDGMAGLTFVDDDTWISVTGRASTVNDQGVVDGLDDSVSDAWFKDGDQPIALRFAVDHGEWWSSPGFVRTALSVAKAKATGDQPNAGERGAV